jgi:hypothetical protein
MKFHKTLPDKPSELLRVAIDDFQHALKLPNVRINMANWWKKDKESGVCEVCLAGAVMLNMPIPEKFFPTTKYILLDPGQYSEDVRNKLKALNWLRVGEVLTAFEILGLLNRDY